MVVLDTLFCYAATILGIYISIMTLLMLTYGPARYLWGMLFHLTKGRYD